MTRKYFYMCAKCDKQAYFDPGDYKRLQPSEIALHAKCYNKEEHGEKVDEFGKIVVCRASDF